MYRFTILGSAEVVRGIHGRLVLIRIMVVQLTIYVETAPNKFHICSFLAVLPHYWQKCTTTLIHCSWILTVYTKASSL